MTQKVSIQEEWKQTSTPRHVHKWPQQYFQNSPKLETIQILIKWYNKMWYSHTMEYYLAIKMNYWDTEQHGWTQQQDAEGKKPVSKGCILYDFICNF